MRVRSRVWGLGAVEGHEHSCESEDAHGGAGGGTAGGGGDSGGCDAGGADAGGREGARVGHGGSSGGLSRGDGRSVGDGEGATASGSSSRDGTVGVPGVGGGSVDAEGDTIGSLAHSLVAASAVVEVGGGHAVWEGGGDDLDDGGGSSGRGSGRSAGGSRGGGAGAGAGATAEGANVLLEGVGVLAGASSAAAADLRLDEGAGHAPLPDPEVAALAIAGIGALLGT